MPRNAAASRGEEQVLPESRRGLPCQHLDSRHVLVVVDSGLQNGALTVGRRGRWRPLSRVVAEMEESGRVLALE